MKNFIPHKNKYNKPNLLTQSLNKNYNYSLRRVKTVDIERIKQHKKLLMSEENAKYLLDFIVHSRLAQDNLELLLFQESIKKDKEIVALLKDFYKYFKNTEEDYDLMEKSDAKEVDFIYDNIYSLVEDIALLRLDTSEDFLKIIAICNNHTLEVKDFCEEQLKTMPRYKNKRLTSSQIVTKLYLMLFFNLLVCKEKVGLFAEMRSYKKDKIYMYVDKVIKKLSPRVTYRAKEDFGLDISQRIEHYLSNYVINLEKTHIASKITLNQIHLVYKKCPKRFEKFLKKLETK